MKISELIERLEDIRRKMGDVPVEIMLHGKARCLVAERLSVAHDDAACFIEAFSLELTPYAPQSLDPSAPRPLGPSPEVPA